MGAKYKDSISDVEHCLCTDADYGWYVSLSSGGYCFSPRLSPAITTTLVKGTNVFPSDLNPFPLGPALKMMGLIKGRLGIVSLPEIRANGKEV
jgi:hypothetical protein